MGCLMTYFDVTPSAALKEGAHWPHSMDGARIYLPRAHRAYAYFCTRRWRADVTRLSVASHTSPGNNRFKPHLRAHSQGPRGPHEESNSAVARWTALAHVCGVGSGSRLACNLCWSCAPTRCDRGSATKAYSWGRRCHVNATPDGSQPVRGACAKVDSRSGPRTEKSHLCHACTCPPRSRQVPAAREGLGSRARTVCTLRSR